MVGKGLGAGQAAGGDEVWKRQSRGATGVKWGSQMTQWEA